MENKLGVQPIKKLIRTLGIPMIVSMVLQAVYNIVDTAFVVNMPEYGQEGNLALTYAFPVQLVIIALGVGTGVGINSILSKYLGEKNGRSAGKIVGNGIFVSAVIYLFFLCSVFSYFDAGKQCAGGRNGNKLSENLLLPLFRSDRV